MTHNLIPGPKYKQHPKPKAVWFDIDNTLVDNNSASLPSQRFLQAVKDNSSKAQIGLATARPLQKAKHIIDAAHMNGLSILSNGAQIYNGTTGSMAIEYVLPLAVSMQIARTLQSKGIDHWIQDDGSDHLWLGEVTASSDNLGAYAAAIDIWQLPEGANRKVFEAYVPAKPFVIVANNTTPEQVKTIQDITADIENVTSLVAHEQHHDDGTIGYEVFILDTRANKHDALLKVIEMLGLEKSETMAVGDGPNDTVIVENAGIGVAVGNAVDQTKAAATYLAPSMRDDGAAIALEEILAS